MSDLPNGWRGAIAGLDRPTGDNRFLATPPGGVRTREYPLALTLGHVGDGEAPVMGTVDRVWVDEGLLFGEGRIDVNGEDGAEYARQLHEGFNTQVSIHPDQLTAAYGYLDSEGNLAKIESQEDFDSMPEGAKEVMIFEDWRFASLAVVQLPAYSETRIEPVYGYEPSEPSDQDAIVAAAALGGQVFNHEFFADPKLDGPTPLTVDENGRVFGHVALWNSCYQLGGGQNQYSACTKPPRSATNYSRFNVHRAHIGNGQFIPCGVLTYGEGHIARGGLKASQENYANVATQGAKVVAGEDRFGIWVSGEVLDDVRPFATDIFSSPLSGHWEPDADAASNLELIAVHFVNVPGFAVRPIIASFQDGVHLDGLTLTTLIDRSQSEADVLAVLADNIADAVLAKIEAKKVESELTAAQAIAQVHKATVVAKLKEDARKARALALKSRIEG